jgi:hypothetical protein
MNGERRRCRLFIRNSCGVGRLTHEMLARLTTPRTGRSREYTSSFPYPQGAQLSVIELVRRFANGPLIAIAYTDYPPEKCA